MARWSATLSSSTDAGTVLDDLGSRFASCIYGTALNAGFDVMDTHICMPGADQTNPRVPQDFADMVFRDWRGMIARVFIESELAWMGRCANIFVHDQDTASQTCALDIQWKGFAYDLERERPELNPSYAEDDATVSASELLKVLLNQSTSLIAKRYPNVGETAVNVGAVGTSLQDSSLSLILNQLKGASDQAIESTFLVWDPYDGPYLQPIGQGPSKYVLRLGNAPGTGVRWLLDEYASTVVALYTDGDNNSAATDPLISTDGPALNGGLTAYKAITVDAVNKSGAESARDSYAALHEDPLGVEGPFPVADTIETAEGGRYPAGLVRAGDVTYVPDALAYDSELTTRAKRSWAIASTSHDLFTNINTVTLDQRSIQSRGTELMTELRVQARMMEPGLSHNSAVGILADINSPVQMTLNTNIKVTDTPVPMPTTRTSRPHITVVLEIRDQGTSINDASWQVGFAIDDEEWDPSDPTMASKDYFRQGLNARDGKVQGTPKPRRIPPGPHTLDVWARCNDFGSYAVILCRVWVDT